MPLDPISRRTMLQRSAATGMSFAFASWLAACGGVEGTDQGGGATTAAEAPEVTHAKTAFASVAFANWPLYIDKAVIKDFNREFDTDLKYTEEINDNEEYFAKVRQELESGQPIGRDLVALTDWMVARWIEGGWLEPLDKKNLPNVEANLAAGLKDVPFDPGRRFSVPWQSGMTAIGYDPKRTGRELTSVEDLFDPAFKGRVSMLTEWRDSAALVSLASGKGTADATKDDVMAAIDRIDEANRNGQIRRFTGNDYTGDLTKGNLWACVAYSGDVIQLQADNPNLEFLIPEEGAIIWSDNMMIPKGAEQPYGAEAFMNYVYEPEVAAKIAAYVNYVSPVPAAREVLAKTDPELAENPLIFPDEATQAKLNPQPSLSAAEEREVAARWLEVTGG